MSHAILLYSERGGQTVFASVHDIQTSKEGVATIEAGTAVSKTGLVKMMQTLVPEDYAPAELLGNHILAKGSDYLVWYCKPQKRQVWFKNKEIGHDVSAATHQPGLVFIIGKGHWYVFAVKGNKRPTSSTPLYVAPYLNVWAGGGICTGNIETPKGRMKFSTEAWAEAFFRSYFTHPNQHEKGALTKYRGGIFTLWRALMKGRAFPTESLVYAGETLGQAFERTVKHGQP
ncbi:MAG: PRTRC system protein B [Sideroxyarcus sp.]|nr:PRTRC system protein B [Sideroxyarcus sp.]